MADALTMIKDMSVLSLQPGDIIVVKTQHSLTREKTVALEAIFNAILLGHQTLVLSHGADIGVLRKAA
jgi:carbamoylphosphate synthase small subunit